MLYMYMLFYYMIMMITLFFMMFMYFMMNKITIFFEYEILKIISMKMEMMILFDWISLLFISIVMLISLMVMIYSMEYMLGDMNFSRFIMLIILFIFSMLMMILSPNMLSILVGWDGLGLISYCLVIFYQSESSYNSGMVTVLTNRIGDILILMVIGLMMLIGSLNFMFLMNMNGLILFMLFFISITKSAQIPFSSWLPMAMAAPTPVSSLVHSSTLVTAGVYLLIRLNYLMMKNFYLMNFMMIFSLLTMFIAGFCANFENDLKKIIAYSTLSQLGLMIFCLSMMIPEISLFHLLSHAMFKSMLFMCAGVIIHNMLGNQDIRYISMVLYNMPLVSMLFNCATFSLCGIPFMSGFFSKDLILEMFLMSMINKFIILMLFISMGLTISYSFRLMFYSFIKMPQLLIYYNYKSLSKKMVVSMNILFIMSIMVGMILSWMLFSMKMMIFLSLYFKLMIYLFMMIGLILGLIIPKLFKKFFLLKYLNLMMNFFLLLWFMPMLYMVNIKNIFNLSVKLVYNSDFGWNEYLGGINFTMFIKKLFKIEMFNFLYLLIFISYLIFFMIML